MVVSTTFCLLLLLLIESKSDHAFLLGFLRTPQQVPAWDDGEKCDTSPSTNDPNQGGICAVKSPLLTGAINSGLVNEITDATDFLEPPKPPVPRHSQEHWSTAVTEFFERLPRVGYDNRLRPNFHGKRVLVSCSMYVGGISAISESNMDFTSDIYFRQAWNDHRLKWNTTELGEHESLSVGGDFGHILWRPDTYIPNAKLAIFHEVTRHNGFVRIMPEGQVKQSIRITVTAHCPMDFRLFPMDSQRCDILIESFSLPETELIYKWGHFAKTPEVSESQNGNDTNSTTSPSSTPPPPSAPPISIVADATSLPQFGIRGFRAVETFVERLEGRNHLRLVLEIYFSRSFGYYLIQIYLPASLVVVISWVSFWVPRTSQPARVCLGVTTVLTLTMMTGQGISSLPKISYLKALDLFMIFCFSMVFLALIEYAVVSYVAKRIRLSRNSGNKERFNNEGETVVTPRFLIADKLVMSAFLPNSAMMSQNPLLRRRLVFGPGQLNNNEEEGEGSSDDDDSDEEDEWSLRLPSSLPSRIECISRVAFPLSFLIFNICYWNYFLNKKRLATSDDLPGFVTFSPH